MINILDDKYLTALDTRLRELRKELESDLAKYCTSYLDRGYLTKRKLK